MNYNLAQYQNHDLFFLLDVDENFWFQIKNSATSEVVDAVAYGDASYAISKEVSVDAWVDKIVIPRANALLVSFFGEVVPPEQGAPWQEQLEFAIKSLKFDEATRTIKR